MNSVTYSDCSILDADVLIDFCKSDRTVVRLISQHVTRLHISSPGLGEVHELREEECDELGLTVVEPTVEQLIAAAERRQGLSFQDQLCLLLANANAWSCITNERGLRNECLRQGIPVVRGLRLVVRLVQLGQMPPERAIEVGTAIHLTNTRITTRILAGFTDLVRSVTEGACR